MAGRCRVTFCEKCDASRHDPTCPEMFWPDGRRRGENPGPPPAKSMTLADEMGEIFAGVSEQMLRDHLARVRDGTA